MAVAAAVANLSRRRSRGDGGGEGKMVAPEAAVAKGWWRHRRWRGDSGERGVVVVEEEWRCRVKGRTKRVRSLGRTEAKIGAGILSNTWRCENAGQKKMRRELLLLLREQELRCCWRCATAAVCDWKRRRGGLATEGERGRCTL